MLGPGTLGQKERKKGRTWWNRSLALQGHNIVVVVAAAAATIVIIVVVVAENAGREGQREGDRQNER